MQTYGQKWRASSSACAQEHVPRSFPPLLRLDSTGDVSSYDHKSVGDNARLSSQQPNMNHGCNVKNWVTNRVLSLNGFAGTSSFSGQGRSDMDLNANMFDYVTRDLMKESVANNMNPRGHKFMQPQCGIAGWNYNGQIFGHGGRPIRAVFPCDRFHNSFNTGYQGLFSGSNYLRFGVPACPNNKMVDQRYQKLQRSQRGHSPKHHKPHSEKKTVPCKELSKMDNRKQKSSPESKCVSNHSSELKTDIHSKPEISKLNLRMIDDIVNMGFDIQSQDQCKAEKSVSSKLDVNSGCKKSMHVVTPHDYIHNVENQPYPNQMKSDEMGTNCKGAHLGDQGLQENDSEVCNVHSLLFRRNLKKGRPSGKKQRHRKMQKLKSSNMNHNGGLETPVTYNEESSDENESDAKDAAPKSDPNKYSASVSFILGLNQGPTSPKVPKGGTANFVISFSDDEDDNDSVDGDWDSDFNFGHIEAEFSQCDLLSFLPNGCNTPSTPINFKVHISPVEVAPNDSNSYLDSINQAWNVQISVKDDSHQQKAPKKSVKKVHFPEDKDLHIVHPMIAWSFAYQAARKGHWENFVRDRERFSQRIQDMENVLVPVLDFNHRKVVYEKFYKNKEEK